MTNIRNLGGLDVSAIGYGAMVLSPGLYGEIDDNRAIAAVQAAIGAGGTFIDTSDAYGGDGHNEQVVGRAIRGRREDITVATKFGLKLADGAAGHPLKVGFAFEELLVNAEPKYIRGYAESSLRNLGIDVIDLYYLHFPDPQVPIEDSVGAMAELVADGKVRHLGVSNVTPDELRRAPGHARPDRRRTRSDRDRRRHAAAGRAIDRQVPTEEDSPVAAPSIIRGAAASDP